MPDLITVTFPAWLGWLLLVWALLNLVHSCIQLYNTYLLKKLQALKNKP